MTPEETREAGIGRLPGSLDEAFKALEQERDWSSQHLGEDCIEGYLASHKSELKNAPSLSRDEQRIHIMSHV